MVVAISLSEVARNRIGIIITIICPVLSFAGLCTVGLGIFIQLHINDELILLEGYNSGVLPNFLVGIGAIMLLINGICAKIAYECGFSSAREEFRMAMLPMIVLLLIFSVVVLSASLFSFLARSGVEDALHDGLKDSMKRYKSSLPIKIALDKLQIKSKCCGSRSHKDWFNAGWMNTKYLKTSDPDIKS